MFRNCPVSVKPEGGLKKSSGYERIERGFHRLPSSRCESMGVSAIEPGRAIRTSLRQVLRRRPSQSPARNTRICWNKSARTNGFWSSFALRERRNSAPPQNNSRRRAMNNSACCSTSPRSASSLRKRSRKRRRRKLLRSKPIPERSAPAAPERFFRRMRRLRKKHTNCPRRLVCARSAARSCSPLGQRCGKPSKSFPPR